MTLNIFLDYKCSLNCDYCTLKIPTGKIPQCKTVKLEDWKAFITRWPEKIKEVAIFGGEPSLVPYLADLVNWLLGKGYHVKVFSNLTNPVPFWHIKQSYKFIISATHHRSHPVTKFLENYKTIKHRIDVYEIEKRQLSFSRVKPMVMDDSGIEKRRIQISPDLKIYLGCYDMCKA